MSQLNTLIKPRLRAWLYQPYYIACYMEEIQCVIYYVRDYFIYSDQDILDIKLAYNMGGEL